MFFETWTVILGLEKVIFEAINGQGTWQEMYKNAWMVGGIWKHGCKCGRKPIYTFIPLMF